MGILLTYNTADVHTYDDLQTITNLNKESLDGALGVLVKSGVLLVEPRGSMPGAVAGQSFALNLEYKSKKLKVNLNQGIKTEQKQESDETHKTVEEDRRMLIQVILFLALGPIPCALPAVLSLWTSLTWLLECDCANHESAQEIEARRPDHGNPLPNLGPIHPQNFRYQEIHRHAH